MLQTIDFEFVQFLKIVGLWGFSRMVRQAELFESVRLYVDTQTCYYRVHNERQFFLHFPCHSWHPSGPRILRLDVPDASAFQAVCV